MSCSGAGDRKPTSLDNTNSLSDRKSEPHQWEVSKVIGQVR
jgi:hypothetical protein